MGDTCVMPLMIMGNVRVIGFEVSSKPWSELKNTCAIWTNCGVEIHKAGLSMHRQNYIDDKSNTSSNPLVEANESNQFEMTGYKLSEMFTEFDIDTSERYIIKIDCEGGEKAIIEEGEPAFKIAQGATQLMWELHPNMGGGTCEQWADFLNRLYETHELRWGGWVNKSEMNTNPFNTRYVWTPFKTFESLGMQNKFYCINAVSREWMEDRLNRGIPEYDWHADAAARGASLEPELVSDELFGSDVR